MDRYGSLFHGPASIAIPIGLPLLIIVGSFLRIDAACADSMDEWDDEISMMRTTCH